jgi:polysaccharide deacetylase family protein (PEP-CTERM system associated)
MINALTVDVEDWYQTADFRFDTSKWDSFEDRIEKNTEIFLELFDKYNVKGTFFVLGYIAKKHPGLVKRIAERGHEIGSHGMLHLMVNTQTPNEFRKDVADSKKLLEGILGKEIDMYRSSTWSIGKKTLWALEILEEEGYRYDSSMQSFRTHISGYSRTPCTPFYPIVNGRKLSILEFPSTVLKSYKWKLFVPFSGGLYFRLMPYGIIKNSLKWINKKTPGMIYVHPWEIDIEQPRYNASLLGRITHYYNIGTTFDKLESVLQDFKFAPIKKVTEEKIFEAFELA